VWHPLYRVSLFAIAERLLIVRLKKANIELDQFSHHDVVGQEKEVAILRNAMRQGKMSIEVAAKAKYKAGK
jgi:hypothetical protein